MPISINGSGTITGIAVGGIPDGVVDTDVIAANAVTTPKLGANEASGLCKAWANFSTTDLSIRESFNVSSITDNGNGDSTINFLSALPDNNYAVSGHTAGSTFVAYSVQGIGGSNSDKTANGFRIGIGYANPPAGNWIQNDNSSVTVAVFR